MDVEEKIRELSQRVEKLEEENKKLKKRNRQLQGRENEDAKKSSKISRRKFLKMLGVGAGGLALSSSAAGLTWSKITPRSQGTSDINAEVASGLTSSAVGDGLKKGQSSALSVEPSDFAGSGLQDDGSDNLALSNDSLSVTAGDGLKGGGSVALGGSTTLNIEPADFAGSGLQDDGNDNLQVNESQIATEEWELIEEHHDSNTGSVLDKTFDVSGESYDRYEVRWEFTTSGDSGLYCEFNNITEYDYWLRGDNGLEQANGYNYLSLVGGTFTGGEGNVGFGELRASAISDTITFSNTVASSAYTDQAVSGVAIGSVSSLNSIRLYSSTDNATGDLYLYGRNNG